MIKSIGKVFKVPLHLKLIFTVGAALFVITGCGGGTVATTAGSSDALGAKGTTDDGNTQTLSLKSKREYAEDVNTTTAYRYDDNGYLIGITKENQNTTTVTAYKYFENYHVLKEYENDKLISITTYTERENQNSKYIFNRPISLSDKVIYIYNKDDSVLYHNNLQIKTYIKELEFGGLFNRAERYEYNSDSFISKIQNGHFNMERNHAEQFYNDDNTSFLLEESKTIMPFEVTQSYRYQYDENKTLTQIQYDIYDDGAIDQSLDINVTYHPNGFVNQVTLETGDTYTYNSDGYITTTTEVNGNVKSTKNYSYSEDYKTITVTDDASGNVLEEYIFE